MKTKLLALALLAGGSMFAETRFSIGVHFGGYGPGYYAPAPPVYAEVRPPCPGPDYFWDNGYWVRQPRFYNYESRGRERYERRGFDDRRFDRDDRHGRDEYRGRGSEHRENGYGNGFRNR